MSVDMYGWTEMDKKVLSMYAQPIVHMRRQFQAGQFGLVLGAGISKPLRVPLWKDLNKYIAKDPEIEGEEFLNTAASEPVITYRLFMHFKLKKYSQENGDIRPNLKLGVCPSN